MWGNYYAPGYSQTIKINKTEFSNNHSVNRGGGIFKTEYDYISGTADYSTLTVVNNTAGISGGGIYSEITDAPNTFKNLIVWDNEPQSIVDLNTMLSIVYSDIEGGWTGTGNINSDPLFKNANNEDYQLTWINFPML